MEISNGLLEQVVMLLPTLESLILTPSKRSLIQILSISKNGSKNITQNHTQKKWSNIALLTEGPSILIRVQ